jgi:ATP-dependent helicase Lhr and Lhr-like helicase
MTIYKPKNPIIWVDTEDVLRRATHEIGEWDVVGLDCETKRDFTTLCLVQISTPEANYLIDPLAISIYPLADVFECTIPLKVVHSAAFERRVLREHGFALKSVFDTLAESRRLARTGGDESGHGLDVVCQRELGITIDKGPRLSDWTDRPLTPEQLNYAAVDAEVLLPLHAALSRA